MSKLSQEDVKLFYKLMHGLLFYANSKFNVIKNISTKEEFFKRDIEETVPLRKKIYKNPEIFDEYSDQNPEGFNEEELSIIRSWKKFKKGELILAKHTKDYAVFFDENEGKAYAVLGLTDSFKDMFEGYTPIMMDIVLLPFKGKITYEGIFMPYNIHFGGGIKKSLKINVGEAIQKYGIITNLDEPVQEKKTNDEEMLRFYMSSNDKMNRYWDEINELRRKSPRLTAVYYQEWAKHAAKPMKKSLKRNKIKGHFAVLDEAIVASAPKPKELEENIKKIVPEDKKNWIYTFRI